MADSPFRYFSDIPQRQVDWLWYPYIPYGKLTLLQGDPGEGKSTLILNIAAAVSLGKPMPDGYLLKEAHGVIYQCTEDDLSDTIKPRLIAADADCSKVAYIVDEAQSLTLEDGRIEETLALTGARLLILDPIQSFLVQDGDMQSASRMRSVLGKLSIIAARYRCAIVLVGHMNKAQGGKSLYRGLGSIDIAAIARSVLMVTRDSSNQQLRYMVPIKSSLAAEGPAVGFSFDSKIGFQWVGPCEYSIEADCTDIAVEPKSVTASQKLYDLLSAGDLPSTTILEELSKVGVSRRTAHAVKKEMGIVAYRKENAWFWSLPEEGCK